MTRRLLLLLLFSPALALSPTLAAPPCEVAAGLAPLALVGVQPPDSKAEAPAEPPKIAGQDVVPAHKLVRLTVSGIPVGHFILWDVYPPEDVDAATQKAKSLYEFAAPPGVYKVRVRAFKPDSETPLEAWRTVTVQGARPPPEPGPTPPGPQPPGPTPPAPAPPIAGDGNRVLIVYETGDRLPASQAAIITSGVLRDYLDAKTAKDEFNPTGAYRIWDQNVILTHPSVSPSWKAAMARPRASTPWLVVSNGKTGFEGPLPKSVPDTLALLKTYFGE
jgi:hypothetical protein